MISDVLLETVNELDRYLSWVSPTGDLLYGGSQRAEILRLRTTMIEMRLKLDAPPAGSNLEPNINELGDAA